MGEITALAGFLGLSGAFALVGLVLAGWMAWRIVEKAGLPGWAGLGAILLTLTGIGTVVPLVLLWVFAFMRWPRDEQVGHAIAAAPLRIAPPAKALADRRGWKLEGGGVSLTFDGSAPSYRLTGGPAAEPTDLVVPDPSVGTPHARLLTAGMRVGLEDLGTAGGTFIDGARLLPEHGPRDISAVRSIRLGNVELTLSRV
jgi:FHA domain-containing protein